MNRKEIRELCMTMIRKDLGDTEEQERVNRFINQALRDTAKYDKIPVSTTLTLDDEAQALLPSDYLTDNYAKQNSIELDYVLNGNTIFFNSTYANSDVTFHYFKTPNSLTQDDHTPEIQLVNHDILAFGGAMYYFLMKDDTQYEKFKFEFEDKLQKITPLRRKTKKIRSIYSM